MTTLAHQMMIVLCNGEEVPGFIAYGLIGPGQWRERELSVNHWPDGTQAQPWVLHGDSWEVRLWDVSLPAFPPGEQWRKAVYETLAQIIAGGCTIAWIGSEGLSFTDPPSLLLPEEMSGSVLASLTSAGDFECPIDPYKPWRTTSDHQLLRLRNHAHGLADAPS